MMKSPDWLWTFRWNPYPVNWSPPELTETGSETLVGTAGSAPEADTWPQLPPAAP